MAEWSDQDSALYRDLAPVAVPRRREMLATIVSIVPFDRQEPLRFVELGSGDGRLAEALLDAYPAATIVLFDGSEAMRNDAARRLTRFGDRVRIRAFDLATLDWWDVMHGADVVVSSLAIHHLVNAKKQYLYKAICERLSQRGAFIMADLVEPVHPSARRLAADVWDATARQQAVSAGRPEAFDRFADARGNCYRFPNPADRPAALFHQLVWLRHAGFAAVDCFWMYAAHAVIGGFKSADGASGGVTWAEADALVARALDA